ncbi:winged helix-turn-helix domain-containing protein [Candidatus Binatia bacterium]|nr:winged helix-turn-helix domain-containing protein [Candidatus Binatia bacterium]
MRDNDRRTGVPPVRELLAAPSERLRRVPQRRRLDGGVPDRPRRPYERGRLRIDFDAYEVYVDGRAAQLFLREFELLCFFVQWPNRVFDRAQIIESIWGDEGAIDQRTIDVHVRRLRALIELDPARPELIVTVRRVGYKFNERALAPAPDGGSPASVPRW